MAKIYFVRDGAGDTRTNKGLDIPLSEILHAFPALKVVKSQTAPTFNGEEPVNPVAPFRHVVVHIQGETGGSFISDGYWLLCDVSPATFNKVFPKSP